MKKSAENLCLGLLVPPSLLIIVNDKEEFMIEEILDARLFGREKKLIYLVKWLGYTDLNWQDIEIVNELEVVDKFQ